MQYPHVENSQDRVSWHGFVASFMWDVRWSGMSASQPRSEGMPMFSAAYCALGCLVGSRSRYSRTMQSLDATESFLDDAQRRQQTQSADIFDSSPS